MIHSKFLTRCDLRHPMVCSTCYSHKATTDQTILVFKFPNGARSYQVGKSSAWRSLQVWNGNRSAEFRLTAISDNTMAKQSTSILAIATPTTTILPYIYVKLVDYTEAQKPLEDFNNLCFWFPVEEALKNSNVAVTQMGIEQWKILHKNKRNFLHKNKKCYNKWR